MSIPTEVTRLAETVFEEHDGGDTVGYMAAAIMADRKEQGDWKAALRYCEGQWSDERGYMLDQMKANRKVRDALVTALEAVQQGVPDVLRRECLNQVVEDALALASAT